MDEELKILDDSVVSEARDVLGDKFKTTISYFIEDTNMYILVINDKLAKNDIEGIILPAHTIKSSAKQVGAFRVSKIAEDLEILCKTLVENDEQQMENVKNLRDKLQQEFDQALPKLQNL